MKAKFIVLIFILISGLAYSQKTKIQRSGSFSAGIQVSEPQNDFKDKYAGNPAGLAFLLAGNLGQSPFDIVAGFAWNSMDVQSDDISVYVGEDKFGDEIYEYGTYEVRSNIYAYHLGARFRPFAGAVQPYADVLIGFKNFSTKQKIEVERDGTNELVERDYAHRDFTSSMGWAAGLKFRIAEHVMIEGRVESLRGGEVEWVDPESIELLPDNSFVANKRKSTTDVVKYQIGISMEF